MHKKKRHKSSKKSPKLVKFLILTIAGSILIIIFQVVSTAFTASRFLQSINPGNLRVNIVDENFNIVSNPSIFFPPVTFSFSCQTNTATLGTASQGIYVKNPQASNDGWTVSISASGKRELWRSSEASYDFNDVREFGCRDGPDADTVAGMMTIGPDITSKLTTGTCINCSTNGITLGSTFSFQEGVVDSITLMTGSALADYSGDWLLTSIKVFQTIPAEQTPARDYGFNLVLSVVAS